MQVALHNARYKFVLGLVSGASSVLEIGIGCGGLLVQLIPTCGTVTGVDFDPETVASGQAEFGSKARILQADAKALPFPDASFSHVVCLEVLEHLGDYRAGIEEIHRCLKPGGVVIVSVPWRRTGGTNPGNVYHLYEPGERELVAAFGDVFGEVKTHYQYYEETWLMTFARRMHLRRLLGFARRYEKLVTGHPEELAHLRLSTRPAGMIMNLIIVAHKTR